ncbi:MAG: hypothetical protein KC506_00945, partial [Nanoarchaeota archaeon]|nr:hypothetical protein [Nanoarchaeota archaeon]
MVNDEIYVGSSDNFDLASIAKGYYGIVSSKLGSDWTKGIGMRVEENTREDSDILVHPHLNGSWIASKHLILPCAKDLMFVNLKNKLLVNSDTDEGDDNELIVKTLSEGGSVLFRYHQLAYEVFTECQGPRLGDFNRYGAK